MDRQRVRVWLARLGVVAFVLAMGVWFTARSWWTYVNQAEVIPLPSKPISSEDSGHANQSDVLGIEQTENAVSPHALDPVLNLAREALANHIANHRDYTATLVKQEKIASNLLPPSKMFMKLRYQEASRSDGTSVTSAAPRQVSVYLKTLEPRRQAGREVLWIEGENENRLKAHESGFLGLLTVDLLPTSRMAMIGNRYPITEIGIERLLQKLIERGEQDKLLGPATVLDSHDDQDKKHDGLVVGDRVCRLIQIIHQEPIVEYQGKEVRFEFHVAKIYIDMERLVPLKYASYEWPKSTGEELPLIEEYTYEDLKLNVGLVDKDFDWKNKQYGF
jgi:hypothetical protein